MNQKKHNFEFEQILGTYTNLNNTTIVKIEYDRSYGLNKQFNYILILPALNNNNDNNKIGTITVVPKFMDGIIFL